MPSSRAVHTYRWFVFLLAAAYGVRELVFGSWAQFGGPFRYLTVWALAASLLSASALLAVSRGITTRRWEPLVNVAAVLNLMVVFLYWRLYLQDPALVNQGGKPGAWWLEYYLHALGPLLQWIDALFLHRAFRRPFITIPWLLGTIVAYLSWIEGVVRPLCDVPAGRVTSGLPYPFLNHLGVSGRAVFYATNLGFSLVALALFVGLAWGVRRAWPRT